MSKMSFHSRDSIAEKSKNYHREYLRCSEFLAMLLDNKNETTTYTTRNGHLEAHQVLALLNHKVRDELLPKVPEPNVTKQIMNLDEVTYSIIEQGGLLETSSSSREQLTCILSGAQTWHIVSGWQRGHVY